MTKFLAEVFQDVTGHFSSKRLVTFACVLLMIVGFVCDLVWDLSVPQFMYEAIMFVVVTGVGFSGAEHFAKNKTSITGSQQIDYGNSNNNGSPL